MKPFNRFTSIYHAPALMTPSERLILYSLVFSLRPKKVLEIGSHQGGSAQIIVAALDDAEQDGRLVCVDMSPSIRPDTWEKIRHRTTVLTGDSKKMVPDAYCAANGEFDFVLIDGDHSVEGVINDLKAVEKYLARGGVVLLHDWYYSDVQKALQIFRPGSDLDDCGLVSTQATPDEKDPNVSWGGLWMMKKF